MTFDFGFSMYFLDGPELDTLEKLFIQAQHRLQIHRRHTETTVKLYKDEYEEKMRELKSKMEEAYQQANEAYERYYAEANGNDQEKHAYASHESGLEELEYQYVDIDADTKSDFKEMADHFNKSALVTLYALLETEMRRLCAKLQLHFKSKITLERFEEGDYFQSMVDYLDQVIDMETKTIQPYVSKLKVLQFLRNRIMHNGGEFKIEKNTLLEEMVATSDAALYLDDIPEEQARILRIRSKYLLPYYELISDFFGELYYVLNRKNNFVFVTARLKHLFNFLAADVTVSYEHHKPVKGGQQFLFKIVSETAPFCFYCKMTVTGNAEDQIVFTNQLEVPVNNLERLIAKLPENLHIIRQVLPDFMIIGHTYLIELMLSPVEE